MSQASSPGKSVNLILLSGELCPDLFRIFSLPLLQGDPETALKEPFSVVLTPKTAHKYFGDRAPLGEVLTLKKQDFKVTGILREIPGDSHFHVDFLASFESLRALKSPDFYSHWDTRTWTYAKLRENHPPEEVERSLAAIADNHVDRDSYDWVGLKLQPVTSIHLKRRGSAEVEMGQSRDPSSLYTLSALGFVILLIACINFMNLSTARSATRAREVGVRKVVGGRRAQLIGQFLGESVVLSGIGLMVALALVELLLPAFNALVGEEVSFNYLEDPSVILLMIGAAVAVGLVAGTYPALFLSAFQPVQVLKGTAHHAGGGGWFRRGLVVFQFVLSAVLIVSTLVMYRQHRLLTTRALGFDKEHLICLPLWLLPDRSRNYGLFKNELLQNPRILSVTVSSNKPGVTDNNGIQIRAVGSEEDTGIGIIYVDADYVETLGVELAAGRGFSGDIPSDAGHAVLLNESALERLGTEFGPGKRVELFHRLQGKIVPRYDAAVIGVIRDFNHRPLYGPPQPLVFAIAQSDWAHGQALVRISPEQVLDTAGFIETRWRRLFPDLPFRFSFLDEDIERVYRSERRWQTIFFCFTALAIFVASLGLFGLASFTAERRTKEIGIRRTIGASVASIVLLLSREFTWLVAAANVIAWPVAYFALNRWLQGYHYRTDLGVDAFVLGGALTLVIAWLTVGYQAVRAATANPVDALRYE